MVKKAAIAKTPRAPKNGSRAKITAARAAIKEIKPVSAKAAQVMSLLCSWLTDESGYDEETWPKLKKALDQERSRVGARRLFHG